MSRIPAGSQHAPCHELVERNAARPFGEQGEHDEAAVAVREPLAGRELRGIAVEDGEELLGRRELVHRDRHDVVGDLAGRVLVEVVADAGAMRRAGARR